MFPNVFMALLDGKLEKEVGLVIGVRHLVHLNHKEHHCIIVILLGFTYTPSCSALDDALPLFLYPTKVKNYLGS